MRRDALQALVMHPMNLAVEELSEVLLTICGTLKLDVPARAALTEPPNPSLLHPTVLPMRRDTAS